MFIDKTKLKLKAGDGGNGAIAFRREKYVPNGGPAGGDGGHGADIIFKGDRNLSTLLDLRYNKEVKGKKGENGQSKRCHGKNAQPTIVRVPIGTTIINADTRAVLADITTDLQEFVIAKGGRGGRGNMRFANPKNPAPEVAENGEPGEELVVDVELRVLADCGLVGFPSVGKSTLLSVVSKARPAIADYHFTTITPNLGLVDTGDHRSFVMADLPGLIEGAHQGKGLGHQFLRHIERCRVIVHVIDMAAVDGRDPIEDYRIINNELTQYKMRLMERPQIVVANKMDLLNADLNLELFKEAYPDVEVFEISALTHTGLRNLLFRIADLLAVTPEFLLHEENEERGVLYKFQPEAAPFFIEHPEEGMWDVIGPRIEKLFKMTNFSSEESTQRFARTLRQMGVDDELRTRGAVHGDTVRIMEFEFEFID